MWILVEMLLSALIILLFLTEFLIPILTNKPIFGSFRKEVKSVSEDKNLEEKIEEAKEKVDEVKKVQSEVSDHLKKSEQLKKDSDNLLK